MSESQLINKHFIDWECSVFGYGYGTGEEHILKCLHQAFSSLDEQGGYDHRVLEKLMGPAAAWLLLNTLLHANVLTYGVSSRFGWLDNRPELQLLKNYIVSKTPEELYAIVTDIDDAYVHCYPSHCNCATPCNNPMFRKQEG